MMNLVKKISLTAAGGILAAACASAPPPPPPKVVKQAPKPKVASPQEMFTDANAKATKGDYKGAVVAYDKILAKQPGNSTVLYNKAVAHHRMGDLDGAIATYQKVVAADPTDTQAALNLGAALKVRAKAGDLDQAIKIYDAALEKDEFNSALLNNLSVLQRQKKQYRESIATLRKLLMRDQKNVDAYKNLALVYYDQEKYKLTQTILDNALKMSKEQKRKDPDIYVNLGMVFLARKENGKAMAAFKKALELDPNNVPANNNIGALALGHRDYGLAVKSYEVVAKAKPTDSNVAASLGYAYQGKQDFANAQSWLEKARTLRKEFAGPVSADDESQMILQLMIISQSKEDNAAALKYAEEYMKSKGITCTEEDFDGFCGRYNGIKMMIQMEAEASAPPPELEKPKATGQNIFTEEDPTEGEGEAPVDGEAPADGAAAPADGATPPADGTTPPAEGGEAS